MKCRLALVLLMVALFVLLSGCSLISGHRGREKAGEQRVSLSDVPAPARDTIERLTAGGKIEKIDREKKGDTVIYDVEAQVGGKHVEYDVDSSGAILTSGEDVPYESLPRAVRAAAEKHFGASEGLQAFKEIEGGQTFYEVVGRKGAAKRELKLTDAGQIVEDEEE
jgi:uncharacterized protein YceK